MPWTVDWRVFIDGADVTTNMRPFLISIAVVDKDGTSSDSCNLSFDDSGGQCLLPKKGAKVIVLLQGVRVFDGVVDATPWTLTRGGGRILDVNAKGFDTRGKAKQAQLWHADDITLKEALQKAGKLAGITDVIVDPEFASISRPYWSPDGASFLAWGQKLAREMGATFKVRGEKAVFAKRGGGASAAGGAMPTIVGSIPGNVLSVSIDPSKGRDQYTKARVRFFDRQSASYKTKEVDVEAGEGVEDITDDVGGMTAADEGQAENMAKGRKRDAEREAGGGTVELDLAVEAQAEGTFVLIGARPGIDGTYRIAGVTHRATRSSGASTSLEVKQPQGEAGKDSRKPSNVPVPTPAPR